MNRENLRPAENFEEGNSDEAEKEVKGITLKELKDQWNEIEDLGMKFMEVEVHNDNFEIESGTDEIGTTIFLKNKSGKIKNLRELLPSNYTFEAQVDAARDMRFANRPRRSQNGRGAIVGGEILYDIGQIKYRGFILSVLHEIGHIGDKDILPQISNLEKISYFASTIKNCFIDTWQSESHRELRSTLYPIPEQSLANYLPIKFWEKHFINESGNERRAWAYALKMSRQLQKEGYEVFDGFNSNEEIMAYISYCLWSYDAARIRQYILERLRRGKDSPEKINGNFYQKTDRFADYLDKHSSE